MNAAADDGQIVTLLLARETTARFPTTTPRPNVHNERPPGDIDLPDETARRGLDTGGDVVVMDDEDVPGDLAATLRY